MHKRMSAHGDYDHMGDAETLIILFKEEKELIKELDILKRQYHV